MEAFNDYRRTGFPAMTNTNNCNPNFEFVNRLAYPTSEVISNSAHIHSINVFTSKVWWAGGAE